MCQDTVQIVPVGRAELPRRRAQTLAKAQGHKYRERERQNKTKKVKEGKMCTFSFGVCVCETSEFDDVDLATQLTVNPFP